MEIFLIHEFMELSHMILGDFFPIFLQSYLVSVQKKC